jgi:hypothetical protein
MKTKNSSGFIPKDDALLLTQKRILTLSAGKKAQWLHQLSRKTEGSGLIKLTLSWFS